MKRVMLLGVVCLVAIAVAPVASASAAVNGVCKFHGAASFSKGTERLSGVPQELGYSFAADNATPGQEVSCTEAGGTHTGKVTVEGGDGLLSCGASVSKTEGNGTLTLPGVAGSPFKFKLSFVAAAGGVGLVVKNEASGLPEAAGAASFAKSTKEPATSCPTGVHELEFDAVAAGSIS